MRYPTTASLILAGLFLPVLLSAAAEPPASDVAVHANGDLSANELATLIGAYIWKLDIDLPAGTKKFHAGLRQQAKGAKPEQLGSDGVFDATAAKPQLLVAIVPIGNTLAAADKLQITILQPGGMTLSMTTDNPMKSLGLSRPQTPESTGHGFFQLIGGYRGNTIAAPVSVNADELISLEITPE